MLQVTVIIPAMCQMDNYLSLLILVNAFASLAQIKAAYEEAGRLRYRFYSFGDGMLIL